ncbi:hypothetical protein KGY64_07850 [Candidatus Bipolaricaulota bacterium]|nr:hypothetical protein [Candidatus Bipolaricaulota bacterium]
MPELPNVELLRRYLDPPDNLVVHPRLVPEFEDGGCMSYDCQRNPDSYFDAKELGPDALDQMREEEFREAISQSRGMIKSTLMDQKKIAGVGNSTRRKFSFSPEFTPGESATTSPRKRWTTLYEKTQEVLRKVNGYEANPDKLPST